MNFLNRKCGAVSREFKLSVSLQGQGFRRNLTLASLRMEVRELDVQVCEGVSFDSFVFWAQVCFSCDSQPQAPSLQQSHSLRVIMGLYWGKIGVILGLYRGLVQGFHGNCRVIFSEFSPACCPC